MSYGAAANRALAKRRIARILAAVSVCALLASGLGASDTFGAPSGQQPTLDQGTLGGAAYRIDVPANWNGTLLLYSHGYVIPGSDNPAVDAPDPATRIALVATGYALAGSAYRSTGWAVAEAMDDQLALLDYFVGQYGEPQRTIAWGTSMGGLITAGLIERAPARFAAAMPTCGVMAGGIGSWNAALDGAFVLKTLLAPSASLDLVRVGNPQANVDTARAAVERARATPAGRARLALVVALFDVPGWYDPQNSEPAADDYATQLQAQTSWLTLWDLLFGFGLRAELEERAGGNPSWNTDVDYRAQLARSRNAAEVRALYAAGGLDLDADLGTLNAAPHITADPAAAAFLASNLTLSGTITVPV
ncbi:MAG: hypothetical protein QOF51_2884, partial [Chloroflexota bacterium]|nr:hypothetical protein [Chloroflexota bacterium]